MLPTIQLRSLKVQDEFLTNDITKLYVTHNFKVFLLIQPICHLNFLNDREANRQVFDVDCVKLEVLEK